jgi:hypothetical protein
MDYDITYILTSLLSQFSELIKRPVTSPLTVHLNIPAFISSTENAHDSYTESAKALSV